MSPRMSEQLLTDNLLLSQSLVPNKAYIRDAKRRWRQRRRATPGNRYRIPFLRISALVISRFGERDLSGRWCCAVKEL
jgi:hypothetical protein